MARKTNELLATAKRRREVLKCREAGMSWEDTARVIENTFGPDKLPSGWDKRYAYKDLQRELEKLRDELHEEAENHRDLQVRRIDRMLRGVWQKALGGKDVDWRVQREAIDRALKLEERRSKLLGLDAPKEHGFADDGRQPVFFEWPGIRDEDEPDPDE